VSFRVPIASLALLVLVSLACQACSGSGTADASGDLPFETAGDGPTPPPGLVVYDLVPAAGSVGGGTEVTLSGDGFAAGMVVTFGGAPASVTSLQAPTTAVVVTPPAPSGLPGAVDVALTNPGDDAPYVLTAGFRYEAGAASVTWCRLVFPPELTAAVGVPSTAILGRVRVDGATEADGAAPGVVGQVGFGPEGVDPSDPSWTWSETSFHGDADSWYPGDRAADEVAGRLIFPATGRYDVTVRFSTDGATWTVCDLDGGTFEAAKVAHAKVVVSLEPGIAWARFVGPAIIVVDRDRQPPFAVGRVLATGQSAETPPLLAQFGLGPRGTFPSEPGWAWVPGTLRGAAEPVAGEPDDTLDFDATPPTSVEGVWATAWRFSADDGATWTYGDLDGSDNEPAYAALGLLPVGRVVEDCRFDSVAELTVALGDTSSVLAGVVGVTGLTDEPGPAPGLVGQLGWGPVGSDPRIDEGWSWSNAAYQSDSADLAEDVYTAALQPVELGDLSLAYRFSADAGSTWLPCDRSGGVDGFSIARLPTLHVVPAVATQVDWCRLVGPLALQVKVQSPSAPISGQVRVQGRTGGEGPGFGIRGELGLRPTGSSAWTWVPAEYGGDANGPEGSPLAVDVYRGVVVPPATGSWQTAFRFSADGGLGWTECDADGSSDGFEATALGSLSVFADLTAVVDEAVLTPPTQLVAVAGWRSPPVHGRVRVPGFTDAPAELASLAADVGFGPPGSVPVQGGWSWAAAGFAGPSTDAVGFHAYTGQVLTPEVGTFALAVRFSLGDGLWTVGDTDGSANGYAASKAGVLTVVAPAQGATIGWCALVSPVEATLPVGQWSPPFRGEVFLPNLTAAAGWAPGIVAQVGLVGGDLAGATWFDAGFVADSGTNDAYEGAVLPATTGSWHAAFRFSTDGGVTWTACDANGPPYAIADGAPVQVVE